MKTDFSWLHLTDFHQGMSKQSWLLPGVKDRFFKDLKKLHEKSGPWDLVLFTGDLTNRGSAEEFKKLNIFLEELWKEFKRLGSSPKLLAVPGNHDLVRPNWNDDPDVQSNDDPDESEFWNDVQSEFWNTKSPEHKVTEAFKNYTNWLKNPPSKVVDNLKHGILPGDFSVTIEKGDAKLGIVGLNSTFIQLTDDDYKGKLVLHGYQFQAACGGDGPDWAKQHHACLLLTHQPPSWLNDNSQQNHLNGQIADSGRFAAHLCGHLHEANPLYFFEGGANPKYIWQGCSLFGLEDFGEQKENTQRSHGYTAGKIELNGEKGRLIFWPRREIRLKSGERRIVSDQSVNLIDEYHTIPREFNLLKPYHDIFVSYAGADKNWVTTLVTGLHNELGQKLGRTNYSLWMDEELRGNEHLMPNVAKQLENSAIFLLVLSRNYLDSSWCQQELSTFLAKKGSDYVFIVERENVQRPKELIHLPGYKFWIKDGGKSRILATPNPHPEEREYYQKLDDLARELSGKIKSLGKAEKANTSPTPVVTPIPHKQTVFLALVSDVLEEYRDEIKRYLEQQNVQVLPTKLYPFDNDFQQQLKQDLKQCDLFVQLLNENRDHDLPKLQYEYANAIDDLPILQWHDNALDLNKVSDQDHKDLLLQSTVIASTLVEFQEQIINQLKPPKSPKPPKDVPLVYINAAQEDMEEAREIQKIFKEQGIGSTLPLRDSDHIPATDIQKYVEQNLQWCDAVIVLYDKSSITWVNEQVLYCRRMQGMREQPFKVFALYDKHSPEKQHFPMVLPNLHVLKCPTPQIKTCLPEFVRIL